ncbi:14758_t:CDS:2 [Entrophospora sp. SA101]|nr:14758_t:CDS:2 [Entrophospora sp. SA101]
MSRIANSNVAGYMQGVGQALTDDTTYHISSSATTVLGATAEVAEAITLFLPMIGLVAELTAKIIEAYNNAQINKRSCTALVNRVQAAEVAVQALVRNRYDNEEKFKDKNYYHCFQRFVNLLKDIKKFIVDVTQMSGLKKFFQSGSIKSKFERYIKDFDSTVNDLNLAVVIASEEQRQKDFKVISDSFETIMKFLENVAGNVAVVKTHNNEKIIEMNTNFSIVPQLKHQVDQLTKQLSEGTDAQSKPKPKPKFIQPNELKNARHYTNCTQDSGKILRKMYMCMDVICKRIVLTPENDFESDRQKKQSERIQAYLTILANLRNSPYILNFLGLTKLHGSDYMVFEFAQKGNLKEIYENEDIDWPTKIQLAVDICRGIVYIHGCNILHHDIRCENILLTDKWLPKITNFEYSRGLDAYTIDLENSVLTMVHWFPPEKMLHYQLNQDGKVVVDKKKYSPYTRQSKNLQDIQKHVTSNRREDTSPPHIGVPSYFQNYIKIITQMWKPDPDSRPDIVDLFNSLYDLLDKVKPDSPMPLEEGIKAHKAKNRAKAWKCFCDLSADGNMKAKYWKGYYLFEGYHVKKDIQQAAQLFKEAADSGIADAQVRYAFCILGKKPDSKFEDDEIDEIIKYMTMASNNGNVTALYNLGEMYYKGKVVKEANKHKGLEYLRLAAIQGHERAIEKLQDENIDLYWGEK